MHTHEHQCCTHDCLHYCRGCSKVYCCKCKAEWGNASYTYWVSPWYNIGTAGTGGNMCGTVIASESVPCAHSHN